MKVLTSQELEALEWAKEKEPTPKNISHLSKLVGQEIAGWAFTQLSLRDRAKSKFSNSQKMIFTRDGYEMATHERIAELHASLFPRGVEIVDLTCGIGADLIAFAKRGEAIGVDLNNEHVRCSLHNLSVSNLEAHVVRANAKEWFEENQPKHVFLDPARRNHLGRTMNPEDFSPSMDWVQSIVPRCKTFVMKLSPMLSDRFLAEIGGKLIFVSHLGACPEVLVTYGVDFPGDVIQVDTGEILIKSNPLPQALKAKKYFYELDPAAIRAHSGGSFGLSSIGDSPGYLTGDDLIYSPWLKTYETIFEIALRKNEVKKALLEMDLRIQAIKVRGVDLDPHQLKKQMKTSGTKDCILAIYSVQEAVKVAFLRLLKKT